MFIIIYYNFVQSLKYADVKIYVILFYNPYWQHNLSGRNTITYNKKLYEKNIYFSKKGKFCYKVL